MRHVLAAALILAAAPALADGHGKMKTATASLKGGEGADHGTVTLTQTPAGVLLVAELKGVPAGEHGFHIHETGKCDAPDFKSAGGHYNPTDAKHGFMVEGGPHAGDMPNFTQPEGSDTLAFEVLNAMVSLDEDAEGTLMDEDGSAIIIHSGADDYESQPSGDAGSRIACGVVAMK